jgi:hypothetical protein
VLEWQFDDGYQVQTQVPANAASTAVAWIVVAQATLALGLSLLGGLGCLVGFFFTWTTWGTVLAYLNILNNAAGCSH